MTTFTAYFIPCDIEVQVRLGDDEELTADNVTCPALEDGCRLGACPLARLSPRQLRNQIDFLPPSDEGGQNRDLRESARLIETARRRAVAREAARHRRWSLGEGPR